MSTFEITVTRTSVYTGNSDALKKKYPAEYDDFKYDHPEATDKEWLLDCLSAGGVDVFDHVVGSDDEDHFIREINEGDEEE